MMGTDDLFWKRKQRKTESLKRQAASREAYDSILIICEGEETEVNYFKALVNCFELNRNVDVVHPDDNSPKGIVDKAEEVFALKQYTKIYCVFDKDGHTTFNNAKGRLKSRTRIKQIFGAVSVPCFEYWLLLHFRYTTSPYYASTAGTREASEKAIKDLKECLPEYEKDGTSFIPDLLNRIDVAVTNAKRANRAAESVGSDDPSTTVVNLVEDLLKLHQSLHSSKTNAQ